MSHNAFGTTEGLSPGIRYRYRGGMDTVPDSVTIDQAARLLDATVEHVRGLLDIGAIAGRVGDDGERLVIRKDLLAYRDRNAARRAAAANALARDA